MKRIIIFLLIAVGLAAGWLWIRSLHPATAAAEDAKPAAKVETAPLADQAIARSVEVFGSVVAAPSGDRVLATAYDVVVRRVLVAAGARVAAGDLLLEVDPSPDAKLAAAAAGSLRALATKTLAATQQRYDLKLATAQDVLVARQAEEDARFKAESLAARGLGGDGRIVAAASGVVSRIDVLEGSLVPAGSPLLTVSTGGQLEVRLGVEAAEVGSIAVGQPVTIVSSNRADMGAVGTTVRMVGAALDPATGAAEVRASVPDGSSLLLGEHVRAQIELQKKDHALVVPRSAVLPEDDKQILFTVKDGKAVKHEVSLGLATADLVEVVGAGLQAGDQVVTLGNYELEDGMAIQDREKAAKPEGEKGPVAAAAEAKP